MAHRAVLFDVDGTLVDSNDAHAQAWVQALAEGGRRVEFARVRPLIGMGSDKLLPTLTGIDAESETGRTIVTRRRKIFQHDYLPHLRPTHGAQRLVEWLRDDALAILVATSAHVDEVRELLQIAGVTKLVDLIVSGDDVERSKPDPDIVQAALVNGGFAPHQAIMVGDTPYDIDAANRAGVGLIAVRCGGWWPDEALAGALAIYDDPDDLVDRYLLSPFKRPRPARSA